MSVLFNINCARPVNLPFIVPIAECSDRDGEGLPHRIQGILHHLGLVTNCKPGAEGQQILTTLKKQRASKQNQDVEKKSLHSGSAVFETNSVRLYMYAAEFKKGLAMNSSIRDSFHLESLRTSTWLQSPHREAESRCKLTCHPRCFYRRPWRGLTFQRSPFYPICWHRTAWWHNPTKEKPQWE